MPVIWLDRHLHKNGGSTVREVMLRNEEAGNCVYWGWAQTREGWDGVLRVLNGIDGSEVRLPSLCIEAHASSASAIFVSKHLPQLSKLRGRFRRLGLKIPIVLTTRVREPLSYYLSFYRWRIAGMQRHGNRIGLGGGREVVNPIGTSFLEWSPHNLQSVGLLHGDVELFSGLKQGGFPGVRALGRRPHPYWVQHHHFNREHYTQLLAALAQFDVVAPLEHFDLALLCTAELTGLPALQLEEDRAIVPEAHGIPPGTNLSNAAICPDMAACRAHVHRIAPWDVRLYRRVRRQFEETVKGLEPPADERLTVYRRARRRGMGVCLPGSSLPCCCTPRPKCFNHTLRERRWLVPASCVPGALDLQRAVAADMRGTCCTK